MSVNGANASYNLLKILLVEDDPGDAMLISEMLKQVCRADIVSSERLGESLNLAAQKRLDIVLLDMNLPDSSGLSTLKKMLDIVQDLPIVVLTGLSDEEFGMDAVKLGAQDYLVKGEIDARTLKRAINYSIERKKLETALKKALDQLERLATTDVLTGAFNRLKFNEVLEAEIKRSLRYNVTLSLIMFDLDHFKAINDTFGHQSGDHVLRETATLVSANIRDIDIFSRWGGEEFMVLAPNNNLEQSAVMAEKLRVLIEGFVFDKGLRVTASFGIAQFKDEDSVESFTNRVDEALYQAKRNGRNRVEAL